MLSLHLWNTVDKWVHFQVGGLSNTDDLVAGEKNALSKLKHSLISGF